MDENEQDIPENMWNADLNQALDTAKPGTNSLDAVTGRIPGIGLGDSLYNLIVNNPKFQAVANALGESPPLGEINWNYNFNWEPPPKVEVVIGGYNKVESSAVSVVVDNARNFGNATLNKSDQDNGWRLAYNPNGIQWRIQDGASGIEIHPDDLQKFYAQQDANQSVSDNLLAKFSMGVGGTGPRTVTQEASKVTKIIDGISTVEGKVGGKIPIEEFTKIRSQSIHNAEANSITLGKYTPTVENGVANWAKAGPDSYIAKAGDKSTYFDLGSEWSNIQKRYNLTRDEMFNYFNKPALDDAVRSGKTIQFAHDPRLYLDTYLADEWKYLKDTYGYKTLEREGDGWIAK